MAARPRASKRTAHAAIAALTALAAVAPLRAHRLDEYLQAMRVDIGAERVVVELDLTPGASLAADVWSTLDADGDGAIAAVEERGYVSGVLEGLECAIDGQRRPLALVSARFPAPGDLLEGVGVIRLVLAVETAADRGAHRLVLRNQHRRDVGVYLANALRPSAVGISIAAQRRDPQQQRLEVDYVVRDRFATLGPVSWATAAAALLGISAWWRRSSRPSR